MRMSLVVPLGLVLLVGGFIAGGYIYGAIVFSPQNQRLQQRVDDLNKEVSALEQAVSSREAEMTALRDDLRARDETILSREGTIAEQEGAIASLEERASKLEATDDSMISFLRDQLDQARAQATALSQRVSGLEEQLGGATVTHRFTWFYQLQTWDLDLLMPLWDYVESRARGRASDLAAYVDMVTDLRDAPYVGQVVEGLGRAIQSGQLTELQVLDLVVAFVRGMPFLVENTSIPYDGNPRYPLETLFERAGDSEDASILVAAILDQMGYDVALLDLEDVQHMAVGVSLPSGPYGSFYDHDGKRYFYLETIQSLGIGRMPAVYAGKDAQVYPVGD